MQRVAFAAAALGAAAYVRSRAAAAAAPDNFALELDAVHWKHLGAEPGARLAGIIGRVRARGSAPDAEAEVWETVRCFREKGQPKQKVWRRVEMARRDAEWLRAAAAKHDMQLSKAGRVLVDYDMSV